ncbi:hypothetical protein PINS_up003577 [Pythium insidiosum]|nr:hypothetical protein PINS_up003577 [Pythium insidiosum]
MDATTAHPQWPPRLVRTGLSGAIAAPSPDCISLQPALVNDATLRARVGGVEAVGVLQSCHRNLIGYSYMRPFKRARHQSQYIVNELARNEIHNFNRKTTEFVPDDVLAEHVTETIRSERAIPEIPSWQGNAIAGVDMGKQEQAVFFATGETLQKACVYRHSRERRRRLVSNAVDCGPVIRQFEMMGSAEGYAMYSTGVFRAAARGAANCTIVEADMSQGVPQLRVVASLPFDDLLYHVAGSPHSEQEAAFVTRDGLLFTWKAQRGVESVAIQQTSSRDALQRCEYSSHPRVLWSASRQFVVPLDLRQPQASMPALFDLRSMNAPQSEIYSIRRRARSPFQVIVSTNVSLELIDSRMPGQALIAWDQRPFQKQLAANFGLVGELTWDHSAELDQGVILSSTRGQKTISVHPFARFQERSVSKCFQLTPLRRVGDDATETAPVEASQYVACDAPLDLHLGDGGEWTSLVGMCALSDPETKGGFVFQVNDMGDLYCQSIRPSGKDAVYDTAVQLHLPCGVSVQPSDEKSARSLPLPVDALVPEHDSASMNLFRAIPIKPFLQSYPRLPPVTDREHDIEWVDLSMDDRNELLSTLLHVCRPSATLFQLHRYVNDQLSLRLTVQSLLLAIRADGRFHVRAMFCATQQERVRVLDPTPSALLHVGTEGDDEDWKARLEVCTCSPESASEPCASVACVVPHSLVVTRSTDSHVDVCFPPHRQGTPSKEFAAVLSIARELYGKTDVVTS